MRWSIRRSVSHFLAAVVSALPLLSVSAAQSDLESVTLLESLTKARKLLTHSLETEHCKTLTAEEVTKLYVFPDIRQASSVFLSTEDGDGFVFIRKNEGTTWKLKWYLNYNSIRYALGAGFSSCSLIRVSSSDENDPRASDSVILTESELALLFGAEPGTDDIMTDYVISNTCYGLLVGSVTTSSSPPTYRIIRDFDDEPAEAESLRKLIQDVETNVLGYCSR